MAVLSVFANPHSGPRNSRAKLLLAFSILILPFTDALAAGRQQLHGHIPQAAKTAPRVGEFSGTEQLDLAISLPLRNAPELKTLLQDIYDPTSPQYRHFLTPTQFTERFGPSESDYKAVLDFAKSHGLQVVQTYRNRSLVDVRGRVSEIQTAFHTNLHYYQRPDGTKFHAPDTEPSVDLDVPIEHVTGLENFHVAHPMLVMPKNISIKKNTSKPGSAVPFVGSGPTPNPTITATVGEGNATYIGNDFRKAYVPGVSLTGSGQSVGLFELDGYFQSDILAYASAAGLAVNSGNISSIVQSVYVNNNSNFDQNPGQGNSEVALDIDMVLAMAPGAQVAVFEGEYGDDVLAAMANPPSGAPFCLELSSSWSFGLAETDPSMENSLSQMAAQGQSYFQASGDSGAYQTDPADNRDANFSTLVGGTNLNTTTTGAYNIENTWDLQKPNPGASGGGILNGINSIPGVTIPSYQQLTNIHSDIIANGGSTSWRNLPDVSMVANNIYTVDSNGAYAGPIGGTSAAAPLWASFFALTNQQAAQQGLPPVGFANPALYTIANTNHTTSTYNTYFHDINDGTTNQDGGAIFYTAKNFYDLATGLGSPTGQSLINALLGFVSSTPTPTPTPTPSCFADGTAWYKVAPTNFPTIYNFQSLVYKNAMWALGGSNPAGTSLSRVWSSMDGKKWNSTTSTAPFSENGGAAVVLDTNDGKGPRMWEIGGSSGTFGSGTLNNNIYYSFDGITWTQITNAVNTQGGSIFAARAGHSLVVMPDPNAGNVLKMWLIGGTGSSGPFSDVWSSPDGVNWTQVTQTTPNFGTLNTVPPSQVGRFFMACVNFPGPNTNSAIWVIGGELGSQPMGDVWYSYDGANWTQASTLPGSPTLVGLNATVYNGKIWVAGGANGASGVSNQVFTSPDGVNWTTVTESSSFVTRAYFGFLSFNNSPWVLGGWDSDYAIENNNPTPYLNDVWTAPCAGIGVPTPTPVPTPCYSSNAIWAAPYTPYSPIAIAAIPGGNTFVLDSSQAVIAGYNVIDIYSPSGTWVNYLYYPFSKPAAMAGDLQGDLVIPDTTANDVVVFSTQFSANVVVTSANGLAFSGPQGVGMDSNYDYFVADTGNNRVVEMNLNPNNGISTYVNQWMQNFTSPTQVAVDRNFNFIYVVDYPNGTSSYPRIQGIYAAGNPGGDPVHAVWNPNGTSGSTTVTGLAVGLDGNVYVSEDSSSLSQVLVFDPNGNLLETLGGTPGTGAGQSLHTMGIGFDQCGYLYQTDSSASRVQVFKPCGAEGNCKFAAQVVPAVSYASQFGTFGTGSGELNHAAGVAVNGAYAYVADTSNNRVEKFDLGGDWIATWAGPTSGSGNGQFNSPTYLAVSGAKNLVYVADTGNNRVEAFDLNGNYQFAFGQSGTGNGQFNAPKGIALDSTGNNIYVVDSGNSRIQQFAYNSGAPTYTSQFGGSGTGNGKFSGPTGVAWASEFVSGTTGIPNILYVTDTGNNRVEKFTSTGTYLGQWGSTGTGNGQFESPKGIALDLKGNVYVSDSTLNRVQQFSPVGGYLGKNGSTGTGNGQFSGVQGVAFDGCGNLFAADTGNSRVEKFGLTGTDCQAPVPATPTPQCGTTSTQLQLEEYTSCAGNQSQEFFQVINTGTTSVKLSDITVKFWVYDTNYTSNGAETIVEAVNYGGCFGSTCTAVSGVAISSTKFSPACGPNGNQQANYELTISTSDTAALSAGTTWTNIQTAIHVGNFVNFSPGSGKWYSPCGVGGGSIFTNNVFYAVYWKGNLVTASLGAPPSCRPAPTCTPGGGNMMPIRGYSLEEGDFTPTPTPTFISTATPTPTPNAVPRIAAVEPNVSHNGEPIKFVVNLEKPASVSLVIYSLTGEVVYQASLQGSVGVNNMVWTLENQAHEMVASGLYLYVLQIDDGISRNTQSGKIVVLH